MSEKPTTTEEAQAALWSTGRRLIVHLEQSGTGAEKLDELDSLARHDLQLTAASVLDHLRARLFSGSAAKAVTWMMEHCPHELTDEPKPDQPAAEASTGEEVTQPQEEATDGGDPEQTDDPESQGFDDPDFDVGEDHDDGREDDPEEQLQPA